MTKTAAQLEREVREAVSPRVSYRGFGIEREEGTQLGYRTASGERGKGRKVVGFYIYAPDDSTRPIKNASNMKAARAYVDEYIGSGT